MSISVRLFCRAYAKRLVLAYSDSDAGEIGTIYQACNWLYLGKGGATMQYVSPQGRVMDHKLVDNLRRRQGGSRRLHEARLAAAGWTRQQSNPKGRYAYVADTAILPRLRAMQQPYPKRATSIDSDAPPDQGGEGGASPTVALP